MTTRERITIKQIYAAEPRLRPIIEEAKKSRVRAETDERWNYIWLEYGRLKREMAKFIGFNRPPDETEGLGTTDAYEVALRALTDALGVA